MSSKILTKINDVIKEKAPINSNRSSKWGEVRKNHLKENPYCIVCGGTRKLEVHHIKPFHLYPELELEPSNLVTLCEDASYGIICHLFIGHMGSYRFQNPNVLEDAKKIREKITLAKELNKN